MNKTVTFGKEAKNKLRDGINILANAVKITLGPKGRNVIIEDENGHPYVTKDGVSVAKSIFFKDRLQNTGAEIIKEVAAKTNNDSGDGTTTATLLAQYLFNEGLKLIEKGYDPDRLKKDMQEMSKLITIQLEYRSEDIQGNLERIKQVATISANNDNEIGNLIAEAIEKIGEDGVITVNDSHSTNTFIDVVEGMQFDQGFISPYFITDPEKSECVLEDAKLYITTKKLTKTEDVLPIMQACAKEGKPLFIIAQDVAFDALQSLVLNKVHGILQVCAVKAPGFGEFRKEMLEDIAILTNGKCDFEDNIGFALGNAEKITVTKNNFTIINNKPNPNIESRISLLKTKLTEPDLSQYAIENLQQRLAKLSGGIAVIYVGAGSEVELREKKDRIEDALHTTHAALEEGIVSGGGSALLNTYYVLLKQFKKMKPGLTPGKKLTLNMLLQPFKQICLNAGKSDRFIKKLIKRASSEKYGFGFNAKYGYTGDLFNHGVIDATKVVRCALENAVSVAGTLLTTECTILEDYG